MKKSLILFSSTILLGALILSACSKHANPLLITDKAKAARFIEEASRYAVINGKFKLYENSDGYYKCNRNITALDNPFQKAKSHQCIEFFNLMLRYAKSTNQFSDLSLRDLSDKQVILRLYDDIREFDIHNTSKQDMDEEEKALLKQEK